MPEVVSFTAPDEVALVPCDAAAADARVGAGAHVVLRHLRRHRAHRVPRLQPLPDPDVGRRAPAVRRRRPDASPTRSRAGATPRSARSSRSPTASRRPRVGDVVHGIWGHRSEAVVPASRRPATGSGRGRRDLRHLRARRVDRAQRRAGRGGAARRPGRRLRPGRDRPARHPARHARRRRGGRRRHACRGGSRRRARWARPRSSPPTPRAAPAPSIREWSGGGVDAAIELSGNDRALHEAVRSVVVDGHRRGLRLLPGRRRAPAARRGVPPQPGADRGQPDLRHARRRSGPAGTSRGWSAPSWTRYAAAGSTPRSLVTDVVDAADVAAVFERLDGGDPEILQAVLRFPAARRTA